MLGNVLNRKCVKCIKQKLFCTDLTKGFRYSSSGAEHLLQGCIEGNLCSLKVAKTEHSVLPLARHHPFNCVHKIRQRINQSVNKHVVVLLLLFPDNKHLFADDSY